MSKSFFFLLASCALVCAGQNLLPNADFAKVSGTAVVGWELAQPAPGAGYAGAPAAQLGEMTGNRGFRIVQRSVRQALAPLYGQNGEAEYSIMLYVKERTGNPTLLVYCESQVDKFCACATIRDYPVQQWFRVRLRFALPAKPFRSPDVNVWFQGKGTIYASGAYLGPVTGPEALLPGEAADAVWQTGNSCRFHWVLLPAPAAK